MKIVIRKSFILTVNLLFVPAWLVQAQPKNSQDFQQNMIMYTASNEMGDAIPQASLLNSDLAALETNNIDRYSRKQVIGLNNSIDPQNLFRTPNEPMYHKEGTSKLVNGRAFIDIDPVLNVKTAQGKDQPIKIFIQAEGDCEGIYVAKRTEKGFVIKEMNGGISNIAFSWRIEKNTYPLGINPTL